MGSPVQGSLGARRRASGAAVVGSKRERAVPGRGGSRLNRSLERGLSILRVFRPGATLRGNSEIAERTGLPRSTVSRLTQTLVACRFLEYDRIANGYRLGAPVLGLAEAFIAGSEVLAAAVPLMQRVSDALRVNVSLAVADGDEMVYLHTVRRGDIGVPRRVMTGHRTPTEMMSLGRAYLATLPPREREVLLAGFREKHRGRWKILGREIRDAIQEVHTRGYCQVNWLPGITAIATPVRAPGQTYVVNIAVSTPSIDEARLRTELAPALLGLAEDLRNAFFTRDVKKKNRCGPKSINAVPLSRPSIPRPHPRLNWRWRSATPPC